MFCLKKIFISAVCREAVMLNCCDVLNRWMSSYFFSVKMTPCLWAHSMQMLCILKSVLQSFSVNHLYVRMFASFTKSMKKILRLSLSHSSNRSVLKKRNRMNDTSEFCEISMSTEHMMLVWSLKLSENCLFLRKLSVHLMMYVSIFHICRLCRTYLCNTLSNTSFMFKLSIEIM